MKLFYGLIWTLFHVCWMLEQPKLVISPPGGSVTVHCKYRRGDEEAVKYWCKEEGFRFCSSNRTIRTTGSEREVKQNGMSIKDNHILHEFSVVMENVTRNDAGTYLCGVERRYDIWQPVEYLKLLASKTIPASLVVQEIYQTHLSYMHFTCHNGDQFKTAWWNISLFRNQPSSLDSQILVFLKIPIFLTMLAAIVWVHIWYRRGKRSSAQIPESEGAKG
ncbi:CMRF35-like molecule 2 [Candoia aspera]|uniref:CMRF35-like molecule 2 n=1 Tax=Candoia aspera TaxID=51853 RepID=UPI002FD836DD